MKQSATEIKSKASTVKLPDLPSEGALERFDKPLPTTRKPLLVGGKAPAELPAAKPKERLRPPGEVPDRLKYDETTGIPSDHSGASGASGDDEAIARLRDRYKVSEEEAGGKSYAPISQDFQTVHNEAFLEKEGLSWKAWGQKKSESEKVNPDRDPSLPLPLFDLIYRLRRKLGVVLAIGLVVYGAIAVLSVSGTSRRGTDNSPAAKLPDASSVIVIPRSEDGSQQMLLEEKSPFLRSHADNLVDWHPWGDEAFERARKLRRPVFVHIGDSSDRLCREMETDSFLDPEAAGFLNDHFVNVLVDAGERPDIDRAAGQFLISIGIGGDWTTNVLPKNVVMTADRLPVYGDGYLAREPATQEIIGFIPVLAHITEEWRDRRDHFEVQARRDNETTREILTQSFRAAETELTREALSVAKEQFSLMFDSLNGGFSSPKRPFAQRLRVLLQLAEREGAASGGSGSTLRMAELTLTRMARGGICDQVGGGFFRRTTDDGWKVPEFEKNLGEQALLTRTYLEAFALTGNQEYADVAKGTLACLNRDFSAPAGGFFTSRYFDNAEGARAFYTWRKAEFIEVVGEDAAALLTAIFTIRERGNVPADGGVLADFGDANLLYQAATIEEAAKQTGIGIDAARNLYGTALERLRERRETRQSPEVDEKIIASCNGHAIAAFATAAVVLEDSAYRSRAETAAEFVFSQLCDETTGDLRRFALNGEAAGPPAVTDDYAAMIDACIALFSSSGEAPWLSRAMMLQDRQLTLMLDQENGGFFDAAREQRNELFVELKPALDLELPSPNSQSAMNLVRLSRFAPPEKATVYAREAERLFQLFAMLLIQQPTVSPGLLAAYELKIRGPRDRD